MCSYTLAWRPRGRPADNDDQKVGIEIVRKAVQAATRRIAENVGSQAVTYATLMVLMELGRPNTNVLQLSSDLAERFHSRVVGIAASQPMQMVYGDGYWIPGDLIDRDETTIKHRMQEAETEMRAALQNRVPSLEWRASMTLGPLAGYIAREARSTDLVIMESKQSASMNAARSVNAGDLVMQVGRPVIIVPQSANRPRLDRVIVGWKDTTEARRAVCDALPLLKQASQVLVVEVAGNGQLAASQAALQDVVGWLERHDVMARMTALLSRGDDAAQLDMIAQEEKADLIVAGAYGHTRLQEWMLGGVTRDLLLRANERCSLLSH